MPIIRLKNGTLARTDGDLSPAELAKLGARLVGGGNRTAPADPDAKEVKRRAGIVEKVNGKSTYTDFSNSMKRDVTLHLFDVLGPAGRAAAKGTVTAFKDGDISSGWNAAKKEYSVSRKTDAEVRRRAEERSPYATGVGGLVGAMANPIGAETGVGKLAAKIAPAFTKGVKTSKVGSAIGKVGESAIGRASRTGFNQAALTGLVDTGDVTTALEQGALGAGVGGAFGAGAHGAGKLVHAIADRAPANASRVAYTKVADMLTRTRRPNGHGSMAYTPEAAQREMAVASARGSEPMLMDLSPEMHNAAGWLARKPNLKSANALVEAGENRIAGAPDRFDAEVGRRISSNTGSDALALKQTISARRKAQGAADYAEGGAMDTPLQWSDKLQKFFEGSPDADGLIRRAYVTAQRHGDDLGQATVAGGQQQVVPSMRVFDYLKREFDSEIGKAMKVGDRSTASGLSGHLKQLKELIAESNPEYANILARQRDEFEKLSSAELGQTVFKQMNTREGAKKLLQELQTQNHNINELRTGIADALLSMRNNTDSPVKLMRRFMRSKEQRAVLEFAMGGRQELNHFDRFMRRELRAMQSDNMLARGRQSATNVFQQHGDEAESESIGTLMSNVLRGQAYGGIVGAVSGATRTVDQLRRGIGPAAQEEMARILMGRGEWLPEGVAQARKFAVSRKAAERRRARLAAKFGAYAVAGDSRE